MSCGNIMGHAPTWMQHLRAGIQEFPTTAKIVAGQAGTTAVEWGKRSVQVIEEVTKAATTVVQSPDGARSAVSGLVSLTNITANATRWFSPVVLSTKLTGNIDTVLGVLSATRLPASLQYFGVKVDKDGKYDKAGETQMARDKKEEALHKVAANICFLVARTAYLAVWAAQIKLLPLAGISAKLASIPMFAFTAKYGLDFVSDLGFVAGMGFMMVERGMQLTNAFDKNTKLDRLGVSYNVVNLVNLLTEASLIVMTMVGGFTVLTLGMMGVVAATTGIASIVLESKMKKAPAAPVPPQNPPGDQPAPAAVPVGGDQVPAAGGKAPAAVEPALPALVVVPAAGEPALPAVGPQAPAAVEPAPERPAETIAVTPPVNGRPGARRTSNRKPVAPGERRRSLRVQQKVAAQAIAEVAEEAAANAEEPAAE
jgi:hypothetical protein